MGVKLCYVSTYNCTLRGSKTIFRCMCIWTRESIPWTHEPSNWQWEQLRLSYCPMQAPIPMYMSTPPFINPQRGCAARVTVLVLCVCLCVCVSVTQHLTLNVIIRATNDSNLSSGGWRSKSLSDLLWKCFVAKLERFLLVRLCDKSAIFSPRKTYMRMNLDHADSGHFVLTWERRLRVWLLVIGKKTVSMPPTKLCPQCKAAVPVRHVNAVIMSSKRRV